MLRDERESLAAKSSFLKELRRVVGVNKFPRILSSSRVTRDLMIGVKPPDMEKHDHDNILQLAKTT